MRLGQGSLVYEQQLLGEQGVRVFSLVDTVGSPDDVRVTHIDDVGIRIESGDVVGQRPVVVCRHLQVRTACRSDVGGDVAAFGGELGAHIGNGDDVARSHDIDLTSGVAGFDEGGSAKAVRLGFGPFGFGIDFTAVEVRTTFQLEVTIRVPIPSSCGIAVHQIVACRP